jgi:hypothetical protein
VPYATRYMLSFEILIEIVTSLDKNYCDAKCAARYIYALFAKKVKEGGRGGSWERNE